MKDWNEEDNKVAAVFRHIILLVDKCKTIVGMHSDISKTRIAGVSEPKQFQFILAPILLTFPYMNINLIHLQPTNY